MILYYATTRTQTSQQFTKYKNISTSHVQCALEYATGLSLIQL